ncbi:hypothetical protein KZ829_40735 [Actinoplanes hulinensis]|uniref:Uncharacterized protein n=1 Tax=Actinoplanes hulinensis TaxID=1144547 RepID=A0ABS7BGT9_9ACTN|nr:hypothetical protein [Actinoplanes hulinensis]MBW6440069.1 hypothetical protein [Actinoplanes hulinensis]
MGIDWVPARPRAGASEVRELVAAQAERVRRYRLGEPVPASDVEQRLRGCLDIAEVDGIWPTFRTAVIGMNPLFPPEWREQAYLTLLPGDARRAVDRWRWWHGEITAGRMRHYLRRLVAAEAAAALVPVLDLPPAPEVAPAGPPPKSAEADSPVAGQQERIRALAEHITLVDETVRAHNRTVPRSRRIARPEPFWPGGPPANPWIEEFFAWVGPHLDDGHGLYLWV